MSPAINGRGVRPRMWAIVQGSPALVACGALIGALIGRWVLHPDLVAGHPGAWRGVEADAGLSLAVFRYYVDDGLGSNPLMVQSMGADGTPVIANDGLPLVGLLARVVDVVAGVDAATWFGWWLVVVFAAQGAAAAWAVTRWGASHVVPVAGVAVLGCLLPTLLTRSGHPSLMGMFWVFLAVGLVGGFRDGCEVSRVALIAAVLIPVGAWLTHPYLGVMATVLVGAPLLTMSWLNRSARIAVPVGVVGVFAAILVGSDSAAGDLIPDTMGWQVMSAPVLWPLLPTRSDLLDGVVDVAVGHGESMLWPGLGAAALMVIAAVLATRSTSATAPQRARAAQLTGALVLAMYAVTPMVRITDDRRVNLVDMHPVVLLGVPAVLAGVAMWRIRWRWPSLAVQQRQLFMVSVAVMVAFGGVAVLRRIVTGPTGGAMVLAVGALMIGLAAVGSAIIAGRRGVPVWSAVAIVMTTVGVVMAIAPHAPASLSSSLRATSRFMWPMLVLAVVAAVVACWRHLRRPVAIAVVCAAVVVQVVDTASARGDARARLSPNPAVAAAIVNLETEMRADDRVAITPSLGCLATAEGIYTFFRVTIAASWAGVDVQPAARARAVREDCPQPMPDGLPVYVVERHDEVVGELAARGYLCGGELPHLRCIGP